MSSPAHVDLQHNSVPLIECAADIFAYLHQLTTDYPLQNIKFFDAGGCDGDTISVLAFGNSHPSHMVSGSSNNADYLTILQKLNSSTDPSKWVLIDCNDIKIVGLCDFIFTMFTALQDDFDITIPSCQPDSDLCLIGFGEDSTSAKYANETIRKSTRAVQFLEKMCRIIMLCNQLQFDITPRELECVNWVGKGKTSNEIGTILSISEGTVDKHIASACQKLDAVNRLQMIAKAVRMGLI